ncbi:hypothetical protein GCM10023083_72100 [Streptomyces phyllanthi]
MQFSRISPVGDVRGYGAFDSRTSCGHFLAARSVLAETMEGSPWRVKMRAVDFFGGPRFSCGDRLPRLCRDLWPVEFFGSRGGCDRVQTIGQLRTLDASKTLNAIVSITWL